MCTLNGSSSNIESCLPADHTANKTQWGGLHSITVIAPENVADGTDIPSDGNVIALVYYGPADGSPALATVSFPVQVSS